MKRKFALFLLFSLALLLSSGMPVRLLYAHAEYDRSDPAADATIEVAPSEVKIWFTQELFRRDGENRIEVFSADGVRADQDDLKIDDDDRTLASVSLSPNLPNGVYTVQWTVTSADDSHQEEGEFHFTIANATNVTVQNQIAESSTVTATEEADASPIATTVAEAAPKPTPEERGGEFTCFGVAMPLFMVIGALFAVRRRGMPF